ncbi:hypothetical protein RBB50_003001 [Rhinocladiella similis]
MTSQGVTVGQTTAPTPDMKNFMSCFRTSSLTPNPSAPTPSNPYCYDSSPFWQPMVFPELNLDFIEDLNETDLSPLSATNYNNFPTLSDLVAPGPSLIHIRRTDSTGSSTSDSTILPPSDATSAAACKTDSESEGAGHSEHCDRHCHVHKTCGLCERNKIEKRKEQNRKAQRNHRMRNEARLEQLRSKVMEQTQEIDSLKELNQRLLKQIEHLSSSPGVEG